MLQIRHLSKVIFGCMMLSMQLILWMEVSSYFAISAFCLGSYRTGTSLPTLRRDP
jgi:hypothetical protein